MGGTTVSPGDAAQLAGFKGAAPGVNTNPKTVASTALCSNMHQPRAAPRCRAHKAHAVSALLATCREIREGTRTRTDSS